MRLISSTGKTKKCIGGSKRAWFLKFWVSAMTEYYIRRVFLRCAALR